MANLGDLTRSVTISLHNGYFMIDGPFTVKTVCSAPEEDWKTAVARKIPPIPENTELTVTEIFNNFYGTFVTVKYGDRCYSIDPKNLDYVGNSRSK